MAIDANKGTSSEVLVQLKVASYERFRVEIVKAVEQLLVDFEMEYDDLAEKLCWGSVDGSYLSGEQIRREIGIGPLSIKHLNDIAHVFSMEPYILFRPRLPYINN